MARRRSWDQVSAQVTWFDLRREEESEVRNDTVHSATCQSPHIQQRINLQGLSGQALFRANRSRVVFPPDQPLGELLVRADDLRHNQDEHSGGDQRLDVSLADSITGTTLTTTCFPTPSYA